MFRQKKTGRCYAAPRFLYLHFRLQYFSWLLGILALSDTLKPLVTVDQSERCGAHNCPLL
jgi:hypothetical protein